MTKKFAFIIHPRGSLYADDYRTFAKLIRSYTKAPISELQGINYLPFIFPQFVIDKVSHLRNVVNCTPDGFTILRNGRELSGYLVATMTSPEMVHEVEQRDGPKVAYKYARDRTMEAVLYAQNKLGCDVIGLGAYTAPWLNGGLVAFKDERLNAKTFLTHGDSESAVAGCIAIMRAAEDQNIDLKNSHIAIVGASGVVGAGMARIMAYYVHPQKLTLIGNTSEQKLKRLRQDVIDQGFRGDVYIAHARTDDRLPVAHAAGADIIILTTTAQGELLGTIRQAKQHPYETVAAVDVLGSGAIVIDMAMPFNLNPSAFKECLETRKILRVDGGVMQLPGIDLDFDMYSMRGDTKAQHQTLAGAAKSFACLCETITLALLRDLDPLMHIGDQCIRAIDPHRALRIHAAAKGFGFDVAPLQCYGKSVRGENACTYESEAERVVFLLAQDSLNYS